MSAPGQWQSIWRKNNRLRPFWRFCAAVGLALILQRAAAAVAASLAWNQISFDSVFRPLWAFAMLGGFSGLLFVLDGIPGRPLAHMGLGFKRAWDREVFHGMLIGSVLVAACVAAIAVWGKISFAVEVWPGSKRMLEVTASQLWIIATAALAEETAFRGYPFQRLCDSIGGRGASLVLSLAFGLVHLANPGASRWGFINTVLIGILFSLVYLRTGSLWTCWGMHFAWNFTLGFVLGLPVSGMTQFAAWVKGDATGPVWLTGGAYGIEASGVCTLVCAVAIGFFYFYLPAAETVRENPATPGQG